ncbi:choice-of-anchor J domain-containing protein [uncultured Winogradskyella sp.]|uniref:choice-of-anchor J domain-containing protein n=1 Tax=uncultured Winogradskyella sp. TaxID=395353 RepID=UPI002625EA3E|nr:choice-of-anchor J domain-containing protein [uncultured Winogradskyella sp.]
MKKIIYLLAFIGITIIGCNPIEDINEDIDAQANPVVGNDEYTLTDDDYDDLNLGFGSFNSEDQAKDSIPMLLSDKYPSWGQGSSVLVNYNLFIGSAEGLSDFTGADVYGFSNADYATTGSDAFGFYPNVDATEQIPAVLAAQIASPVEGQIVLAEYDQYFETPEIGLASLYSAAFPADYDSFELISVSGPDELGWTVGSANVQGSGFDGGANALEEWLISPEIDLTGESDLLFQITQEIDFLGDDTLIDIMIATDYTTGGDVSAANWTALPFDKTIYGSLTTSEDFDFSAYDGETIHVGLKYSSTDSDSPRWRVQDFAIRVLGVSGDTNAKGEFFVYESGSWEPAEDVYYLSTSDYDSMGEESGQPGRFDNFSSSTPADNYIPTFLNLTYPFAQEEDQIFVIYKYFSSNSGLGTRGQSYTVIEGEWTPHESTITTSLQFGYDEGVWVPDNTIRYTLVGADYAAVVAALADVAGFESAVDNLDSFGNFNRTGTWTDEMLITALDVILDNLDPNAEELQKYVLTIATWAPGNSTEEWEMIKYQGEWITQALYEELTS